MALNHCRPVIHGMAGTPSASPINPARNHHNSRSVRGILDSVPRKIRPNRTKNTPLSESAPVMIISFHGEPAASPSKAGPLLETKLSTVEPAA